MRFHIFAYLPYEDHQALLEHLVAQFGTPPATPGYRDYLKVPANFLKRLTRGIYTDFVEHGPNRARPLATAVAAGEGVHQRFTLELAGSFSPELRRLSGLSMRNKEQEPALATLTGALQTYAGNHGFSSAQPNQLELAEAGFVVVTFEGFVITNDYARQQGRDGDAMREEQRTALLDMLRILKPDFAFSANEDDYELWHMGPIAYFPPVDPWRYLWSFMVFGPKCVSVVGRSTLMSAPATEIYSLGDAIFLQSFDYLFHPLENNHVDYREREACACELLKHLGVTLPYTTFVSAKDLSSCNG